jgi:hypothetical protein
MIKKPLRKIQLSRETLRVITTDRLPQVAGGASIACSDNGTCTCTLHETTGPFPSHGPCGGSIM